MKVVSESALFLREYVSDSSENDYARNMTKNAPCTLNVIRKNNLNRLIFARININFMRNKFDKLASQVKGNTDVVMISETKLDGTFPGSLEINLFLRVLANPSELIATKMELASCSFLVKTYQQDLFL